MVLKQLFDIYLFSFVPFKLNLEAEHIIIIKELIT